MLKKPVRLTFEEEFLLARPRATPREDRKHSEQQGMIDDDVLLPSSIFQRPLSSGTSSGQTTPGRLSSSPTFKGYSFARNAVETLPDSNQHESFSASAAKVNHEVQETSLRDYIEEHNREQLFLERLKSPD